MASLPEVIKKKHVSQFYYDYIHTYINFYLNANLSVATKANVFVLSVIDTKKHTSFDKNIKFTCLLNSTLFKYKIQ